MSRNPPTREMEQHRWPLAPTLGTRRSSIQKEGITPPGPSFRRAPSKVVHSGESSGQVMLQRRPTRTAALSTSFRVVQETRPFSAVVATQKKVKAHEQDISMEEVMTDLRLLEEQQRSAQRKVASVKLQKQQKMQQCTEAEQELHSLRYSNARQREQLAVSRQVLQVQTRSFLSVKLQTSDVSAKIKKINSKLSKALETAQVLANYRCRTDNRMCRLQYSITMLSSRRNEAETCLEGRRTTRDEERCNANLLSVALQSNGSEARSFSTEVTKRRTHTNDLEIDLRNAQSTKSRARFSLSERTRVIEKQNSGQEEALDSKRKLRDVSLEILAEKKITERGLKQSLSSSEADVEIARVRCIANKSEGLSCKEDTLEDEILHLRQYGAQLEEWRYRQKKGLDVIGRQSEEFNQETLGYEQRASCNEKLALSIGNRVLQLAEHENGRQMAYEKICALEQQERPRLAELQKNFEKVESDRTRVATSRHTLRQTSIERISACTDKIAATKDKTRYEEEALHHQETCILKGGVAGSEEKEAAKLALEEVEILFREAPVECDFLVRQKSKVSEALNVIKNKHTAMLQDTVKTTNQLLQKNPSLKQLDFSLSDGGDATVALSNILTDCRHGCSARLKAAGAERARRVNEAGEYLMAHRRRYADKMRLFELERQEKRRFELEKEEKLGIEIHKDEKRRIEEQNRLEEEEKERCRVEVEKEEKLRIEVQKKEHIRFEAEKKGQLRLEKNNEKKRRIDAQKKEQNGLEAAEKKERRIEAERGEQNRVLKHERLRVEKEKQEQRTQLEKKERLKLEMEKKKKYGLQMAKEEQRGIEKNEKLRLQMGEKTQFRLAMENQETPRPEMKTQGNKLNTEKVQRKAGQEQESRRRTDRKSAIRRRERQTEAQQEVLENGHTLKVNTIAIEQHHADKKRDRVDEGKKQTHGRHRRPGKEENTDPTSATRSLEAEKRAKKKRRCSHSKYTLQENDSNILSPTGWSAHQKSDTGEKKRPRGKAGQGESSGIQTSKARSRRESLGHVEQAASRSVDTVSSKRLKRSKDANSARALDIFADTNAFKEDDCFSFGNTRIPQNEKPRDASFQASRQKAQGVQSPVTSKIKGSPAPKAKHSHLEGVSTKKDTRESRTKPSKSHRKKRDASESIGSRKSKASNGFDFNFLF